MIPDATSLFMNNSPPGWILEFRNWGYIPIIPSDIIVVILAVELISKNFAPVTFVLVDRVPKYITSELTLPVAYPIPYSKVYTVFDPLKVFEFAVLNLVL